MDGLERIEGVLQVDSDVAPGLDEIQVNVDRSLAKKHRVSPMVAAQTIAFGLRGYALQKMKTEDREIDVQIQLEEEDREDVSKLKDLQLLTEDGQLIPISVVARFSGVPGAEDHPEKRGEANGHSACADERPGPGDPEEEDRTSRGCREASSGVQCRTRQGNDGSWTRRRRRSKGPCSCPSCSSTSSWGACSSPTFTPSRSWFPCPWP